jgi:hypothetical protein
MLQTPLVFLLMLAVPLQGLAVPHLHREQGSIDATDHGFRPHLHLGHSLSSHRHSHRNHPATLTHPDQTYSPGPAPLDRPAAPSDHDDDAVYVATELRLNLTAHVPVVQQSLFVSWVNPIEPKTLDVRGSLDVATFFLARGGTPIYLTTLSLRL